MKKNRFLLVIFLPLLAGCAGTSTIAPPTQTTPAAPSLPEPLTSTPQLSLTSEPTSTPSPTPTPIQINEGGKQWLHIYRGADIRFADLIQQTSDGDFIVLDWYRSLLKLNENGIVSWYKTPIGENLVNAVYEANDGGFVLLGYMFQVPVIKFSKTGEFEWSKEYDRISREFPPFDIMLGGIHEIQSIDGNGVLILDDVSNVSRWDGEGNLISQTAVYNGYYWLNPEEGRVGRTTQNGVVIGGLNEITRENWVELRGVTTASWRLSFSMSSLVNPSFIRGTRDGGVLFASSIYSYIADGAPELWLVRLNKHGDVLWQRVYEAADSPYYTTYETPDGGFLFATSRYFYMGDDSEKRPYLWLIRIDNSGDLIWEKIYGDGQHVLNIHEIIQTTDGDFVLAGAIRSYEDREVAEEVDMLILRINHEGDIPGCSWLQSKEPYRVAIPSVTSTYKTLDPREAVELEVTSREISQAFEVHDTESETIQICVYPSPP